MAGRGTGDGRASGVGKYDQSSKWLIQHCGNALLRLAGYGEPILWEAVQSEAVHPGQLPDGLVRATLPDRKEPGLFLFEIATYPEARVVEQMTRGMLITYLDRKQLPEGTVVVLRPKGRYQVPSSVHIAGCCGESGLDLHWRVVDLSAFEADALLDLGDPGLAAWSLLGQMGSSPKRTVERCRQVIETHPDAVERRSLLTIAQIFLGIRYNEKSLLQLLGGHEAMIESPVLDQLLDEFLERGRSEGEERGVERGRQLGIVEGRQLGIEEGLQLGRLESAKRMHARILDKLQSRLGVVSQKSERRILQIFGLEVLEDLLELAVTAPTLEDFEAKLAMLATEP